jgi:hypothetical protein
MALKLNVGTSERWLRVVTGLAMAAAGLYYRSGTILGYLVAASGVVLVLTGVVRWCPMCYIGGRQLPKDS